MRKTIETTIEFTYITKAGFYKPKVVTLFDGPLYRGQGITAYMIVPKVSNAVARLKALRV